VGAVVDERLEGEIHVTVIATGFETGTAYRSERNAVSSFLSSATSSFRSEPEVRGAKIPPFLLNRQGRSDTPGESQN
jgi:cell division protein FtsZ